MSRRTTQRRRRRLLPLIALSLVYVVVTGCSETVSFLTIDLQLPSWNPPLVCDGDPRRVKTVTVRATCDGEILEASGPVDQGSLGLEGLPLGECKIEVEALNASGRTVLTGESSGTLERDLNTSISIQLLEAPCDKSGCDTDGDDLADLDEKALKIDPEEIDSDKDGLEDGLEVLQCCTAPDDATGDNGRCQKLLIQRVEPGLGLVGTTVLIKASAPLNNPQVSLGGSPLTDLFADATIVLGRVAKDAALGDVVLVSDNTKALYPPLFAVLRGLPELVTEISHRAAGNTPPMYQLVDQTFSGPLHYLLGRSITSGPSGATNAAIPILVQVDHTKTPPASIKAIVSVQGDPAVKGEPVAMAASDKLLAVVLSDNGSAVLALYNLSASGATGSAKRIVFGSQLQKLMRDPMDLVVEPQGDLFQLLLRGALVRFQVSAEGKVSKVRAIEVREMLPSLPDPNTTKAPLTCTGLGIAPVGNATTTISFLGCNQALVCPPGAACDERGYLVRVPAGCLALKQGSDTSLGKACGTAHLLAPATRAVGAPVVDLGRRRVHLLTTAGLVSTSLDNPSKLLPLHVAFPWPHKAKTPQLMALHDNSGHLFVADGPMIRRLEPYKGSAAERLGRGFPVGGPTDEATTLVISPDRQTLAVGRQLFGSVSSLMGICLAPPCD